MKKSLTFDLAKSVATYRNAFIKSVAQMPSPVFTEEMKLKQQEAIDSAKVVYKLTPEDHAILSDILEKAKNSTVF